MSDTYWSFMFLMIYQLFSNAKPINTEGEKTMEFNKTVREVFEERIRTKLANPEISAAEIETLARAYSELTKNDHMHEMMKTMGNFAGFGSSPVAQAQLTDKEGMGWK